MRIKYLFFRVPYQKRKTWPFYSAVRSSVCLSLCHQAVSRQLDWWSFHWWCTYFCYCFYNNYLKHNIIFRAFFNLKHLNYWELAFWLDNFLFKSLWVFMLLLRVSISKSLKKPLKLFLHFWNYEHINVLAISLMFLRPTNNSSNRLIRLLGQWRVAVKTTRLPKRKLISRLLYWRNWHVLVFCYAI